MSKFELLKTESIELDLENPRIARFLDMYAGRKLTKKQIRQALHTGLAPEDSENSSTTYRTLKESIKTNGGLINPIIVNKKDNKFTVVEGNTRVAIYKELEEQNIPGKWDEIPALVYEEMDSKQIDGIRLQAHLVGIREWDAYSKAKYLHKLRHEEHLTWNEVVEFCGGRRADHDRAVTAYTEMEKYYKPLVDGSSYLTNQFSGFVELQRGRVKEALVMHDFDLTDFSKWIADGKLKPLNTIRKLPNILDNPEAKKVFLKKNAREAEKILDAGENRNKVKLEKLNLTELCKEVTMRFRKMEKDTLNEYRKNPDHSDIITFQDLMDELTNTFEIIERN